MIDGIGWSLSDTVASAASSQPTGGFGGPGRFAGGPFGFGRLAQSGANAGSALVKITAPIDLNLILLAVALAVAGGLLAGAIGGLRAARLRPAAALRTVE